MTNPSGKDTGTGTPPQDPPQNAVQPQAQPQQQQPTPPATPPVHVNHPSGDALAKLQQAVQGLPDAIVNGLREAGAQIQQAVSAPSTPDTQTPPTQQTNPAGTQPTVQPPESSTPERPKASWLTRKWFGEPK